MNQQMNSRDFKNNYSSRTISFVLLFFFNLLVFQTASGQIIMNYAADGSNTLTTSTLTTCTDGSGTGILFSDDDSSGGNYSDAHARIDTVEICPTDYQHYVQVLFTSFDIEPNGDKLEVYQGDLAAVRLGLGVHNMATGAQAFGGFVIADCNPIVNPSGCLTFIFRTDGDTEKGSGWDANVDCVMREIELENVTIPSINLNCQDDPFTDITIPTPAITACGTLLTDAGGDVLYHIKDAAGTILKSDTLTSGESLVKTFAIGQYSIEYSSLLNSQTLIKQFSVQTPSLVCNDEVESPLGAACAVQFTPDDLLDNPCDTISGVMYYNITVTLGSGSNETILTTANFDNAGAVVYPTITKANMDAAGISFCGGLLSLKWSEFILVLDSQLYLLEGKVVIME